MPRILLVEDDEFFRKMVRLTLGRLGHEVIEAPNGNDALRLCEEHGPDLVLTDIIMPDREGLETIGLLRAQFPGIRIVAMSGGARFGAHDVLKVAKLMGARRVLTKPFTTQELSEAIAAALAP